MKVVYFWGGIYSNWYPCKFMAKLGYVMPVPIEFNCAEQFMMAAKAIEFLDWDSYEAIMRSRNPKIQKALGRKVKDFDETHWKSVARDRVYPGIWAKFTQYPEIVLNLLNTQGSLIAEASPYDKFWGIGLSEDEAVNCKTPLEWQGQNWLGQVLMKVRDDILENKTPSPTPIDWTKYQNDHLEYS